MQAQLRALRNFPVQLRGNMNAVCQQRNARQRQGSRRQMRHNRFRRQNQRRPLFRAHFAQLRQRSRVFQRQSAGASPRQRGKMPAALQPLAQVARQRAHIKSGGAANLQFGKILAAFQQVQRKHPRRPALYGRFQPAAGVIIQRTPLMLQGAVARRVLLKFADEFGQNPRQSGQVRRLPRPQRLAFGVVGGSGESKADNGAIGFFPAQGESRQRSRGAQQNHHQPVRQRVQRAAVSGFFRPQHFARRRRRFRRGFAPRLVQRENAVGNRSGSGRGSGRGGQGGGIHRRGNYKEIRAIRKKWRPEDESNVWPNP